MIIHVEVAANQNSVQIFDLALERAIRERLDIHHRPLTKDDLASLTNIRAVGRGISDLSGIEHASELTKLVLGANNITDLSPLSGFHSLVELHAWNN